MRSLARAARRAMVTIMTFDAVRSAARTHGIDNYVAGVVRDGAQALVAVGVANGDTGAPMTEDSIFRIYSMTKAVTTAAVMQLVEQGKVELDAPAARYAPGLEGVQVLEGFGDDGAPKLRPPRRAPTVRDLLLHTSGLGYTLWNADLGRYFGWAMGQGQAVNPMLDLPLTFDPGEAWEYGIGIDWAGRMVEEVSGQGLDAYFEANIFRPLGMADTGFAPKGTMDERLADSFFATEDGQFVRAPRAPAAPPDFGSGGGGLLSTAPDYLKFVEAMAGDGSTAAGRILEPATVAQMAACDTDAPRVRSLPTAMPAM